MKRLYSVLTATLMLVGAVGASELRDSTFGANEGSALLQWSIGGWGSCSASAPACGRTTYGSESRTVRCLAILLAGGSENRADAHCIEGLGPRPASSRSCSRSGPACPPPPPPEPEPDPAPAPPPAGGGGSPGGGAASYSCPAGWSLSGTQCRKVTSMAAFAVNTGYCIAPAVYFYMGELGFWCVVAGDHMGFGASHSPRYTVITGTSYWCGAGWTLSGNQCTQTEVMPATRN